MKIIRKLINNKTIIGSFITLLIWLILHLTINSRIIPSPFETIILFLKLMQKNLLLHIGKSLYRIIASVFIALIIGVPFGVFIGLNNIMDKIFSPVIYILYPIPKIAFLPVFMLLLGLGDGSKLILIITIIIFPILLAVRDGIKEISTILFDSVISLGLNRTQILTNLVIPAILPKIFSALRVSIGISLSALFFSENFATNYGLGYFIMNAWTKLDYIEMFAGILALSLLGFIIFKFIDLIEKKLCPWILI